MCPSWVPAVRCKKATCHTDSKSSLFSSLFFLRKLTVANPQPISPNLVTHLLPRVPASSPDIRELLPRGSRLLESTGLCGALTCQSCTWVPRPHGRRACCAATVVHRVPELLKVVQGTGLRSSLLGWAFLQCEERFSTSRTLLFCFSACLRGSLRVEP